jgi:hypothetical protein
MFCICKSLYCPDEGIQRWCRHCDDWFDVACLVPHTTQSSYEDITGLKEIDVITLDETLKMISATPIMRGGETGPAGYAKAILNARKMMYQHGWEESDIKRYIGKHIFEEILNRSDSHYQCPNCKRIL